MKYVVVFLIGIALLIVLYFYRKGGVKISSIPTGWTSGIRTGLGGLGQDWMKVLAPLGTILFIYGLLWWFYPEWAKYLAKNGLIVWILAAVLFIGAIVAYVPWKFVRVVLIVPIVAILGLVVTQSVDWKYHFPKLEVRTPSPPSPAVAPTRQARKGEWIPVVLGPSPSLVNPRGDYDLDIRQEGPGCIFVQRYNKEIQGPFCKGTTRVPLPSNVESVWSAGGTLSVSILLTPH